MSAGRKIIELMDSEITVLIQGGELKVCVIGIGRIGLPTALSFAQSGLSTIGLDINERLVDSIKRGEYPLKDEPGYEEIFDSVLKSQKFTVTTRIEEAVPQADVVVLSLPTPMNDSNIPDYSALESVGRQLNEFLSHGSLVIAESTIEPGFIENEMVSLIEGRDKRLTAGKDFSIGVCPETANPGQILKDFAKLPRLVGGIDERTREIIMMIYRHVFAVQLIPMPDCKTANAVKLTTNVFRDVNIAFVNELALLFQKVGVDIITVLDAAKTKYNFQAHYPGAGAGGPCLPVNSYQILNMAKRHDIDMNLVRSGREVNEKMPSEVVRLLKSAFDECNISLKSSNVLVLGVSYKPNVRDIQITPAESVIEQLRSLGVSVRIYDPYFKNSEVFGIRTEDDFVEALTDIDAIVLVTAHKEFHDLEPNFLVSKMRTPVFIDSRGIIDSHEAEKSGLNYRGIGRR